MKNGGSINTKFVLLGKLWTLLAQRDPAKREEQGLYAGACPSQAGARKLRR